MLNKEMAFVVGAIRERERDSKFEIFLFSFRVPFRVIQKKKSVIIILDLFFFF